MYGLKKIIKNSSWLAAEQVIRMAAGLFVGVWIARHLGPSEYGVLSFALALSSMVGIFANLGLNRSIVRELTLCANDELFARRIVASAIAWRLLFSAICYAVTVTISIALDQGDPMIVGIVAASIAFTSFDVFDLYFQSKTASVYSVLARASSFLIFLGVKIWLLTRQAEVFEFAIVTSLEAMGNAIALWIAMKSFGIRPNTSDIDLNYGWTLIKASWPELFAGFACLIFMRIDQVMLANLMDEATVGQYAVASRLAEAWYFIPGALVTSTFPAIVKQRQEDRIVYLKRIHQLFVTLVAISYLIALLVTLFGSWVITNLYGSAYENSANILVVLIWSGLFVSLGTASGSWIMAEGKPILNLTRNTLGALFNIGFNLYLIPRYGAIGAAFGTLMSLSVAYVLSDFFNPQTQPIGVMKIKSLFLLLK